MCGRIGCWHLAYRAVSARPAKYHLANRYNGLSYSPLDDLNKVSEDFPLKYNLTQVFAATSTPVPLGAADRGGAKEEDGDGCVLPHPLTDDRIFRQQGNSSKTDGPLT